jgi:hypothetical protein
VPNRTSCAPWWKIDHCVQELKKKILQLHMDWQAVKSTATTKTSQAAKSAATSKWWLFVFSRKAHITSECDTLTFMRLIQIWNQSAVCRSSSAWTEGLTRACRDTKCLSANKHIDQALPVVTLCSSSDR